MSEDEQPPWAQEPTRQDRPQRVQEGPRSRAVAQAGQERQVPRTAQVERQEKAQATYQMAVAILKDNGGTEAKAIKAMLGGSKVAFDKYVATVFSLLATNSEVLEKATAISIVNAVKVAAGLGLEPMTDDGGLVVYGDQATFMPSWQGYLKRIRNSGKVQDVDVQVAYANDEFTWGWSEKGGWFRHAPAKANRGDFAYFYAYAVMPSGFVELEVMTDLEVRQVRDQFARGIDRATSPWVTSYAEMGRKTVVRRLRKRLPQEAAAALELADQQAQELEDRMAQQANLIAAQRDELATVRDMALAAVGQLPAGAPEAPETRSVGPGAAEAPGAAE
jgi:phage RecT family recombinase